MLGQSHRCRGGRVSEFHHLQNGLFDFLDFETISSCNRTCRTCIRNSHPDREEIGSWFEGNLLSEDLIYDAIDQALTLGFRGGVCLSHYNEPLMDNRLATIARKVRSYSELARVFLNSNGDFLTKELASELDGVLDRIIITLYMKDPAKTKRADWMRSLFTKTRLDLVTESHHTPTHFTPAYDLQSLVSIAQGMSCGQPKVRVIINHRRQYLLCCDDVVGNFDLGTFPEIGIGEHWFGKQKELGDILAVAGGRTDLPYCMNCPRGAPWR